MLSKELGIIKDAVIDHLLQNNLLCPSQHGFVPRRSCVTNLLEYLEEVTAALDAGDPYDTVMIDFRRAFDVVPFRHLLRKLEAHGILGNLLRWFDEWTNGRQQRVVINGRNSEWADVISSAVQGSVIGPILFLIFINDIDFVVDEEETKVFKFADDSKFGRRIRSNRDSEILQADLDGVARWADQNGMSLHPQKTVVMHFGHNNPHHQYSLSGMPILSAECARDLGVKININCTPTDNVVEVTKKANSVLAQLRRTTVSRSQVMVTSLYKTYVRPIVESSIQAWNPWLRHDVDCIEKIQRRATKLVSGIGSRPYEERMQVCGLTSLEDRRVRGDLIQCFKIMNNLTDIEKSKFFTFTKDRHGKNTRGAAEDLLVPQLTRLDTRKFFFSNRVVNPWNDLPMHIRNASSVNGFKNAYDDYISSSNALVNNS